jgi:hypothetical protein
MLPVAVVLWANNGAAIHKTKVASMAIGMNRARWLREKDVMSRSGIAI